MATLFRGKITPGVMGGVRELIEKMNTPHLMWDIRYWDVRDGSFEPSSFEPSSFGPNSLGPSPKRQPGPGPIGRGTKARGRVRNGSRTTSSVER